MDDSVTTATAISTVPAGETDSLTASKKRIKSNLAWAGSLVGSKNPDNLGYRTSTITKRYRASNEDDDTLLNLPDNLQIQLRNRSGQELAETLDIPVGSSIDDLSALVQSLLNQADNERVPYTFYTSVPRLSDPKQTDEVELLTTLKDLLIQNSATLGTEQVLSLTYQPLAVFRVRPIARCTDTLPGHTEAVLHVSFSPDGQQLASGGGDTTVRFWDVNTNLPRFTGKNAHKDHVLCTAWSPDGKRFISADKRGVWISWEPSTGKIMGSPKKAHSTWITSLAWEPLHAVQNSEQKCERFATSSKDGTIKLWNVRTQQTLGTLSGHVDSVECCKWGGEGLLYSASRDRSIKVWNVDRKILVRTLTGHGHRINTLSLSSEYVLRTGPFNHRGTSFKSTQEALDAAKAKYEKFRNEHGEDRLVSGSDDFTLFLWHPETSKHPIKRLTGHQQAVNHLAFSPDGRYFASASFDKKVKVWNGHSGDYMQTLHGHVGAVYQVTWSPDSRYLVSASKDSTSKLWCIPSGKTAQETLPGHADEVYALDWSPNGAAVATGSKDRTIKIWKH